MRLSDRVALVTGAAGGLGRVIAGALAERGARLALVDVDAAAVERAAAELGPPAAPFVADLADANGVALEYARVCAELGAVPTVLVNCAGGWGAGRSHFPTCPPAEWGAVLDLDLRVPMRLIQLCAEPMARAGGGAVVNIASTAGYRTDAYGCPEYAVAKAGLIRLTTALAGMAASHGVRVSCVVPGWIALPRTVAELADLAPEQRAATPPLIPPAEIAGLVLGLVEDESSGGRVLLRADGMPTWQLHPD